MNLLLFDDNDCIDEQRIHVRDRRLDHLLRVHRSSVGDSVRVGRLGGRIGEGVIEQLNEDSATLNVQLTGEAPPKLPLTLVVALPRPKMLRRILRTVAEFGVCELHLIHSARVEKSYWQTPVLSEASVHEYLCQGLEQAGDTHLPQVHLHRRFKPWVEDELPRLARDKHRWLAHPGSNPPCPNVLPGPYLAAIGPEGGFIPYEVEHFMSAGFKPVSLGPRILRVENAVSTLAGRFV